MSWLIDHEPEALRCDRPDCPATIAGAGRDVYAQRRSAVDRARAMGWQLARHGDVPIDFCPLHVDLAVAGERVVRLYDETGDELEYRRKVRK